jgi:hypothetical protein
LDDGKFYIRIKLGRISGICGRKERDGKYAKKIKRKTKTKKRLGTPRRISRIIWKWIMKR